MFFTTISIQKTKCTNQTALIVTFPPPIPPCSPRKIKTPNRTVPPHFRLETKDDEKDKY